jgi:uncharacterized iron-regulated protein
MAAPEAAMPHQSRSIQLYDGEGHPLVAAEAARRLAAADVVLFGELHGHPAIHQLELELATGLAAARGDRFLLGAEMFEADDQLVLDEFLAGLIPHRHLVAEAKTWDRHELDYQPLVELAAERHLRFVATNAPRRYASLVAREGLVALERVAPEGRRWLAPLPITVDLDTPGYRRMAELGLTMGGRMPADPARLVAAQAVKDATMAHFIAANRPAGALLLHFNGVFHSQERGGIGWYLRRRDPGLDVRTISCVEGDPGAPGADDLALGDLVAVARPV